MIYIKCIASRLGLYISLAPNYIAGLLQSTTTASQVPEVVGSREPLRVPASCTLGVGLGSMIA